MGKEEEKRVTDRVTLSHFELPIAANKLSNPQKIGTIKFFLAKADPSPGISKCLNLNGNHIPK